MSAIGLSYRPVNGNARKNLRAFQDILTVSEQQFCMHHSDEIRKHISSLKTPILPNDTTETVLNRLKPELTGMVMRNNGLNDTEKQAYIKAILNFAKTVLDNSSEKGKMSEKLFKEQLLNMFNSFCTPKPAPKPAQQKKSKFGEMTNTTKWGIGIGSVVLLILIGILIWYFMKKKKGSAAPVVPLASSFGRLFRRR